MGLTFATPNGGNSKKTGHKNSNNNSSANNQTSNYSSGGGHPSAGSGGGNNGSGGYTPPKPTPKPTPKPPKNDNDGAAERAARAKALITQAEAAAKLKKANDLAAKIAAQDKVDAEAKVIADAKAETDAAALAKQISDAAAANEAQKRKASEAKRLKAQADKAVAEKEAKRKALAEKNAAIEAESQRLLAESEALTAATNKKAANDARAEIVKTKREGLLNLDVVKEEDVVEEVKSPSVDAPVETKSTSQGLIDSFIPDFISESLKGEGNYSPEWVEKNKAAGASHLEALYASGQLKLPKSNLTDSRGNAIGGVANSQDNTAMQEMAANGVEDPLTALTKEVSDGTGLDTSFTGAYRQAIDGADGQRYDSGSGLLNYANDQRGRNVEAEELAANEHGGGNYADKFTGNEVNGVPVDDLSSSAIDMIKFKDNLGFDTMDEAQVYWDSMTPEAQAIFNSKENPELSDKILGGIFGLMIPGFGLLNKFMYNDKMSLQEKLEFSNKTAVTVANNKQNMNNGTNQGVADNNSSVGTTPPAKEEPASTYVSLESYLSRFNNRTY